MIIEIQQILEGNRGGIRKLPGTALKNALMKANSETKVKIADKEYTILEALNKKAEEFLNDIKTNQFKILKNDYGFYLKKEPDGGSLAYYDYISLEEKEKLVKTLELRVARSVDVCIWPETHSLEDLEKLIDYMCERPGLHDK